jgi:hypothetical protein
MCLLLSCTHHRFRKIAQVENPNKLIVRLFNSTNYLPKSRIIYKGPKKDYLSLIITNHSRLTGEDNVQCNQAAINPANEFFLQANTQTIECAYKGPKAAFDLEVEFKTQPEFILHDLLAKLIKDLKAEENKLRDLEPQVMCSKVIQGESQTLVEKRKYLVGKIGEFCSTPQLFNSLQITICDGTNDGNLHNGRVVSLNSQYQQIKKKTLPSLLPEEKVFSVDHKSHFIKINDKEFAVNTYDGRLVFMDTELNIKNQINFKNVKSRFSNFAQVQPGTFYYVTGDEEQEIIQLHLIVEKKVTSTIELPSQYFGLNGWFAQIYYFRDVLWITTEKGYVLKYDPQLKEIKFELKLNGANGLSNMKEHDGILYFTSSQGQLWSIHPEEEKVTKVYQPNYSGLDDEALNSNDEKKKPLSRAMNGQMVFLSNGLIVVSTYHDGRLHFLNTQGELQFVIYVPRVTKLFDLKLIQMNGEEKIGVSTISYITFYNPDGTVFARYNNSGAENFNIPIATQEKFHAGMYQGVFEFQLDSSKIKNEKNILFQTCP